MDKNQSSRLGPALFILSLAGSLGLIAMGLVFSINHPLAVSGYGVSLSGGPDNAWISSTAIRDLAYGCLTLVFTLLRDRRAVGLCVLLGTIIPLGDAIIVLRNGAAPLYFLPLHLGGALGCLIVAAVLLRRDRSAN